MKNIGKETFLQSVFALMTSQVIVKILGLFYKLYLTNRTGFGDEGNAIASGAFQVYALVLSITAIGIPNAISKIIAEYTSIGDHKNANRVFKISLIIFSSIGIVGSYVLIMYANKLANEYLHMKEAENSIIALAPSVFLVSIISVFRGYFAGREQIKKTASSQAIEQLVKTFSTIIMIEVVIFITKKINTEKMAMLSNLSITLGNVAEFLILHSEYNKIKKEIEIEKKESVNVKKIKIKAIVKEIFKISVPITLVALITTISKNIDANSIIKKLTPIIGYKRAKKEYGILCGKVDPLINLPLSFNMAITTSLLPKIASAHGSGVEIKRRIKQSVKISMIISLPIFLIYFLFSGRILNILFPKAPDGGEILRISSFSIIFISLEQIMSVVLQGMGKNFSTLISIIVGITVKAILNSILVPKVYLIYGGTKGAALANTVCHMVTCGVMAIQLSKHLRKMKKKEGL